MKYAERYWQFKTPNVEVEPGILVMSSEDSCFKCGDKTNFMQMSFQRYICSSECQEEMWQDYCKDCRECSENCWEKENWEVITTLCSNCNKTVPRLEKIILRESVSGVFHNVIELICPECDDVVWEDYYQKNNIDAPKLQ